MSFEHPLAYLLGIEGIALMRSYAGESDRAFFDARIAEIRRLLDDDLLAGAGVEVARLHPADGYRIWSATYDQPNTAFAFDEPIVGEILDTVPAGVAVDAACGTGRMAASLAARGHRVIGVDGSPEMLAFARKRVPEGEFAAGDLTALPIPDGMADLVVCSLALTHVRALEPVMAEFARVLRPGGQLVISDIHPDAVARGLNPSVRLEDGSPGRIASYPHAIGHYVRAALAVGLQVRRCEEPGSRSGGVGEELPTAEAIEPWDVRPWNLSALAPEAAHAADHDVPVMVIWQFSSK